MAKIRLQSKEDEIFEVDIEVAKMSLTIETMLEHLGNEEDGEVICMPKISSQIMKLVIKWCKHHVSDTVQEELVDYEDAFDSVPRRSDHIPPWDRLLLKRLDTATLFELTMAANYLNIKALLTATSKTVANLIKGKTPDEIRQVFKVDMPTGVDHNMEDESTARG